MGAVIESAVNWAVKIANDNSHGYDQNSRWGPNYDCSSLVISAFEQAGCKVKSGGATYTGNMKPVFLRYGFFDVTSKIALSRLWRRISTAYINTVFCRTYSKLMKRTETQIPMRKTSCRN